MNNRLAFLILLALGFPLFGIDPAKGLKSKDWRERCVALKDLENNWNPKLEKNVKKLIKDTSPEVRLRLIELVHKHKLKGYDKILRKTAVEGIIWPLRDAAARALVAVKASGVEKKLTKQINGNNSKIIIRTIGQMQTEDAVIALKSIVKKKGDQMRRARAVRALGETRHKLALPVLATCLTDTELPVRSESYLALRNFPANAAVPLLLDAAISEIDTYGRHRIGTALMSFVNNADNDAIAIKFKDADNAGKLRLVQCLALARWTLPDNILKASLTNENPKMQAWATFAVSRNLTKTGLAALEKMTSTDTSVQRNMTLAIKEARGDDSVFALAKKLIQSPHRIVRLETVRALGFPKNKPSKQMISLLKESLSDVNWEVYAVSVLAAARLKVDGLGEILKKRITAKEWQVRASTLYACAYFEDKRVFPILATGLDDTDPMTRNLARRVVKAFSGNEFKKSEKLLKWWKKNRDSYRFPSTRPKLAYWQTISKEENDTYNRLGRSEILVRNGGGDNLIGVLNELDFTCTDVSNTLLSKSELNPEMVLCLTCVAALTKEEVKRVDWFVLLGGRLFMTDEGFGREGLQPVVGYASIGAEVTLSMRTFHPIMPRLPKHDLLKGVFVKGLPSKDALSNPMSERLDYPGWEQWGSIMIKIDDPFRTEVLVDSLDLKSRFNFSPMLTTWSHGYGRVMHAVSHFDYQMNLLKGEVDNLKGKMLFPYLVDELGFSATAARTLIDSGKLKKSSLKILYGDFALFRVMANFIDEQNTLLVR